MVGLLDDNDLLEIKSLIEEANKFKPQELNETNVQAIFNRCLATDDTPQEKASKSILFSRTLGYKPEEEIVFYFDKDKLLANKKNIYYLYGQLNDTWKRARYITLESARITYSGRSWTEDNACLRYLLYLGNTDETDLLSPFSAKDSSATFAGNELAPTLTPKDPNFPAWWEAHKGEWEDRA